MTLIVAVLFTFPLQMIPVYNIIEPRILSDKGKGSYAMLQSWPSTYYKGPTT